MNIKNLLSDEDAVSPVIGVILMVAITVILAAVIGTFVLGLGDQVQSSAPNSNFQFDYSGTFDGSSGTGDMTVTHNGGQDVRAGNLEVQVAGAVVYDGQTGSTTASGWDVPSADNNWGSGDSTISTGASVNAEYDNSGSDQTGNTVRVIWESDSGGTSNTIGQSTIPS